MGHIFKNQVAFLWSWGHILITTFLNLVELFLISAQPLYQRSSQLFDNRGELFYLKVILYIIKVSFSFCHFFYFVITSTKNQPQTLKSLKYIYKKGYIVFREFKRMCFYLVYILEMDKICKRGSVGVSLILSVSKLILKCAFEMVFLTRWLF